MALVRKRSATDTELEREPSEGQSPFGDQLKRNRAGDELEATNLIARDQAWQIDLGGIVSLLRSASLVQEANLSFFPGNLRNYDPFKSLFVLCVIGSLQIHYTLLCNNITSLFGLSKNIQVLALALNPPSFVAEKTVDSPQMSLPAIRGVGPNYNYFGKLGLLSPLGGGQEPLDAIVVLDTLGRRRLVLPVGWGAGRYVNDGAGGRMVQDRLMKALRKAVQALDKETSSAV